MSQIGTSPSSFSLVVGQSIQLNLEVVDAKGNVATLATGPNYAVDNAALATLTPNATGVEVTAKAAGNIKVTVTGTNAAGTALSAESDGTLSLPLAVAMALVPGAITG